jgi:hypothetical protein
MTAAKAAADAWVIFQRCAHAPGDAREAFERAVQLACEAFAPYVHGDPRVDRWEACQGGFAAPHEGANVIGFEALAAWSPLCPAPTGFVWERPLRAVEVPR